MGIVHLGLGAFHRAHQAWYTEQCLAAGERDWAILGVSLRSDAVAAQLNPQDGLYTFTVGEVPRVVGAVRHILAAARDERAIASALAASNTRIVTLTVTEKGYCRAPDGSLDFALARRGSFYPLLAAALARRKRLGLGGLTLVSCDNLAQNGDQLGRLIYAWLAAEAPELADWLAAQCKCPNSMVDRIVPATTPADRDAVEARLGLRDEGAVRAERFSQWVIEDSFVGPRPGWECHGAQLVVDIAPYETAKLRMLNGAHSALAYLGLARGHTFVHEAIADRALRATIERLMREEAAPTIDPAPGQDLDAYADELIARFSDVTLNHGLAQIAMDGSQKIPPRWLATLAARPAGADPATAILTGIAAWMAHIAEGRFLHDPLAERLRATVQGAGADAVEALFGSDGPLASGWRPSSVERDFVLDQLKGNRSRL